MRFLFLLGGLLFATAGHAAVRVSDVTLQRDGGAWRLDVKASEKARYTVYALPNPDRLIIDLPDATLGVNSQVKPLVVASGAPALRYSQFKRNPASVRIVLDLPAQPSWKEISASPAMNIALAISSAAPPPEPPKAVANASDKPAPKQAAKAAPKPKASPVPQKPSGPPVLSARELERQMREAGVTPNPDGHKAAPGAAKGSTATKDRNRKARRSSAANEQNRSSVASRDGYVDRTDLLASLTSIPMGGLALPPVSLAPAWSSEEAVALIEASECPEPLRRRLVEIVSDPAIQTSQYVWGAESPGQFDCSGLALYVYNGLDVKLPRVSWQQAEMGVPVEKTDLRAGDLVFFNTRGANISHVGIYLGGGRFLHAANPRANLQITALDDVYYARRFVTARRVFSPAVASGNVIRHGG